MKPVFPRKNLALNMLIEFREAKTIYDFVESFQNNENNYWNREKLFSQIDFLINSFKGLNEEINQLSHTSNHLTITIFFEELIDDINRYNLDKVEKNYFLEISEKWNNEKYTEFLEEESKKENEYFSCSERAKYQHLEKYKRFSLLGRKEVIVTNRNFYCIEKTPSLINLTYLDNYLNLLQEITKKFNESISRELNLYRNEKLIPKSQPDKTRVDKFFDSIKNNKVIAGVIIVALVYLGASSIIKTTKENNENLFGKGGLMEKKIIEKKEKKYDSLQQIKKVIPLKAK